MKNNFVAKNDFNRSSVFIDRKKDAKIKTKRKMKHKGKSYE
jgi:hypothetical protein